MRDKLVASSMSFAECLLGVVLAWLPTTLVQKNLKFLDTRFQKFAGNFFPNVEERERAARRLVAWLGMRLYLRRFV